MNMLKTVYVLIGPKGSGKTYIGSLLEKEIGLKFLSVEKLGLANIPKSKLKGEKLIQEGFHQEEAAIDEILKTHNAVSFESTGAHPYLHNVLARLRGKFNVKLIRVYAPLEICYERVKSRDQNAHIHVSEELLKKINENASRATFDWDLELDNSDKLTALEIVHAFTSISNGNFS